MHFVVALLVLGSLSLMRLSTSSSVEYLSVAEGDRVQLLCRSTLDIDNRYWTLNGTPITDGQDCSCSMDSNNTLVIERTLRDHSGVYTCLLGHSYWLYVIAPPVVDIEGQNVQSVTSGGRLVLTYKVLEGTNITSANWFKDENALNTTARISIVGKTLTIDPLTSLDAGVYSVKVTNIAGSSRSSVTLHIRFPPEADPIIAYPSNLVTPDQSITLTCSMLANPSITVVRWTRRTVGDVVETSVPEHNRSSTPGAHGQTLTTSTVGVSSTGEDEQFVYTCTGNNALGEDRAEIIVREGVAPPPPTGLTSSHISSEDVTLQWDAVDPTLVETIRVTWRIVDRSIGVVDIGKERTSYTIEGLTPGTTYHLTVITVNTVGTSPSEEIPITTLYRVVPGVTVTNSEDHGNPMLYRFDISAPNVAPSDFKVEWKQDLESVHLSWKTVVDVPESIVEGYVVRVEGREDIQVSNTSLYVKGLERGRRYSFSVSAYNNGGEGPSSTVPYRVPPARSLPNNIVVRRISLESFMISWTRPSDYTDLQGYNVTIMGSGNGWHQTLGPDMESVCYKGLKENDNYRVILISCYKDGTSASSNDFPIEDFSPGSVSMDTTSLCRPLEISSKPTDEEGLTPTGIVAIAVVGGVVLIVILTCIIVIIVVCARRRIKIIELENVSSGSHSQIVTNPRSVSPSPDSPQMKTSFVYDKRKDSAQLQYYDIHNMYKPVVCGDIDTQMVGVEV